MKISPVRNNVFYNQTKINKPSQINKRLVNLHTDLPRQNQPFDNFYNVNYLSFTSYENIPLKNPKRDSDFRKFIFKKARISLDEYKDIKEKNPKLLNLASVFVWNDKDAQNVNQSPQNTAKLIEKVKEDFDNRFGESNYIVISVGTSPAFITENLANIGENVIFTPASDVFYTKNKNKLQDFFKRFPKAEIVAQYLKEELSKQEIPPDKKIIVMDFCFHGRTVNFIRSVLENYCAVPSSQIFNYDLAEQIKKLVKPDSFKIPAGEFYCDMALESVASIANTPHYSIISKTENIDAEKSKYRNLQNYSSPLGRAYQLLVLDELEEMKSS